MGVADAFTAIEYTSMCTNLVKTPSNYDNPSFEIRNIRVFQQETAGSGTAEVNGSTSVLSKSKTGTYSMMMMTVFVTLEVELPLLMAYTQPHA